MADVQEALVGVNPSTTILSGHNESKVSSRAGYFLVPCNVTSPDPPSAAAVIPIPVTQADPQVNFDKSWSGSPMLWRRWVEKLRPRHEAAWQEIGILDGLVTSTWRFKRDETVLLEIAKFLSPRTNTFIFPWGEATVTLEDLAVLGGLPALGSCVRDEDDTPTPPKVQEDVNELNSVRWSLNGSKYKKPTFSGWVKHFLEDMATDDKRERIEHAAFLAMWLSMFVLTEAPFDVVQPNVFDIAVRMVHGEGMALAPAALASLYRDLSSLKSHISSRNQETFVVGTPLNVLQLWIWQRFLALRSKRAVSFQEDCNLPRAARWGNVQTRLDSSSVRGEHESPTRFEWMPYRRSTNIGPLGSWVSGDDIARSKELQSFARYIHACNLIGMYCTEKYHPHRVARQFGYDQDVPGTLPRIGSSWEESWRRYDLNPQSITIFVPDTDEPGITTNYMKWWKKFHDATDISKKRMAAVIQEGASTSRDPGIYRQRQDTQIKKLKAKRHPKALP
ncbi:hypothetical protein C2845_PM17G07720 [Panicum miliaceum]|uniref:Aminotransferase-like plant mobile domain-containing protein n=1 Tax=Panicum miliaceum TaxID=4540 RepID=A0A3L6Q3K8_PANMI|nr:hypothetical protein C2845_PM17G07720 [Panicum miliaceum]